MQLNVLACLSNGYCSVLVTLRRLTARTTLYTVYTTQSALSDAKRWAHEIARLWLKQFRLHYCVLNMLYSCSMLQNTDTLLRFLFTLK